jgi:hypothetical protein
VTYNAWIEDVVDERFHVVDDDHVVHIHVTNAYEIVLLKVQYFCHLEPVW